MYVTSSQALIMSSTKHCSFIEENHKHKLESRKQQHAQPSRPGAPSQDLMSFWGTFGTFPRTLDLLIPYLKDISSKLCH